MKKAFILVLIVTGYAIPNKSIGQEIKPDIQYVTLTDTILIKELKKLIKLEESNDTLFSRGKGYINVRYTYQRRQGIALPDHDRIDTIFTYYITTSFMSPDVKENKIGDLYPNYYSIIDNRIICINSDLETTSQYFGFSKKSKNKFNKLIQKYLDVPGSKSRELINLKGETRIHFLKSIMPNKRLSYCIEKIHRDKN